jgi:hypothetical protein
LNRLEALNPVYVFWGLKAMAPAPAGSGFLDERMGI